MKPMLSIKVIDSDTGIVLDADKIFAPTRVDYGPLYRTYRWNFAYSIAENCALRLEGLAEENDSAQDEKENAKIDWCRWIKKGICR